MAVPLKHIWNCGKQFGNNVTTHISIMETYLHFKLVQHNILHPPIVANSSCFSGSIYIFMEQSKRALHI